MRPCLPFIPLQPTSELQELFGLSAEENLVETFKCKLLQTYGCSHNNFTPAIQVGKMPPLTRSARLKLTSRLEQMAFQGTLYITDAHTCFSVEERNRKVRFEEGPYFVLSWRSVSPLPRQRCRSRSRTRRLQRQSGNARCERVGSFRRKSCSSG